MMTRIYREPSPCLSCTRVKDPENCENKHCKVWRAWFMERWSLIHQYPRRRMEQAQLKPVGVAVGGRVYAAPHQVKAYQRNDPCKGCLCPKDLCNTPCPLRKVWEKGVSS